MATLPGIAPGKLIFGLASVAAALALLWAAASAHLTYACTLMDTPYLPLCPEAPTEPRDIQDQMRARIARNPGDSWAWTRLLTAQRGTWNPGVLEGAAAVAPNNLNVLRRRAAAAFERGNLTQGVDLLMHILKHRYSAEAAQVVAQLATTPQGMALLQPHMPEARRWLPHVLSVMPSLKLPASHALPLVVAAMEHGALSDEARRLYMRSLKAGGLWLDAYGLWLSRHKESVPLLYNGTFDQPLEQDGFDWEHTPVVRSRAGVRVEQHSVARRGLVLALEFTGRSLALPIVRQYIFAPPGDYRLRGDYMASKLRSENGLTWNIVCSSTGKAVISRAATLQDTGGVWKIMEIGFTVPADCGPVASLQLEPAVKSEAGGGMRGRVELDNFALMRVQN